MITIIFTRSRILHSVWQNYLLSKHNIPYVHIMCRHISYEFSVRRIPKKVQAEKIGLNCLNLNGMVFLFSKHTLASAWSVTWIFMKNSYFNTPGIDLCVDRASIDFSILHPFKPVLSTYFGYLQGRQGYSGPFWPLL